MTGNTLRRVINVFLMFFSSGAWLVPSTLKQHKQNDKASCCLQRTRLRMVMCSTAAACLRGAELHCSNGYLTLVTLWLPSNWRGSLIFLPFSHAVHKLFILTTYLKNIQLTWMQTRKKIVLNKELLILPVNFNQNDYFPTIAMKKKKKQS